MEENKQYYTPEIGERLSAKEWVENLNKETGSEHSDYSCNYLMMERYANYKSRIFQAEILQFRNFLESEQRRNTTNSDFLVKEEMSYLFNYLLRLYDKHFGIVKTTEGKI
jgi:hypothetical protein